VCVSRIPTVRVSESVSSSTRVLSRPRDLHMRFIWWSLTPGAGVHEEGSISSAHGLSIPGPRVCVSAASGWG